MRKIFYLKLSIVVFVIIYCMPYALLTAEDALWLKAVQNAENNASWCPGAIIEKETVFDNNGSIIEVSEMYFTVTAISGNLSISLNKAYRDGADVTEQQIEKAASMDIDALFLEHNANLFRRAEQNKITSSNTHIVDTINDRVCNKYTYRLSDKNQLFSGTTWLDTATGTPSTLILTMQSVPYTEGNLTMTGFTETFIYSTSTNGSWYPVHDTTEMNIEITQNTVPVFQGMVVTEYTFSDYFIHSMPETPVK